MSPKVKAAKEQLLSLNTVIAIVMAVLGGGGASYASTSTMAYRLEQLEKKLDASKEAELDKRLTRLEDAQDRTDKVVVKMNEALDKMNSILAKLPAVP